MTERMVLGLALLLASHLTGPAHADVVLPSLFSDHAVLQRDMPVPVWGTAAPGERVRVSFGGQTKYTTASESGAWRVTLDSMPASQKPTQMVVEGNNAITVADLRIGEVWLVGGPLGSHIGFFKLNAESDLFLHNVRMFKVGPEESAIDRAEWQPFMPEDAIDQRAFFAFSDQILHVRQGTPVGLLLAASIRTKVARWTHAGGGLGAGAYYDAMVRPMQPYAIRGAILVTEERSWQETDQDRTGELVLPRLIDEWHADWGQGEFPFLVYRAVWRVLGRPYPGK